MYKYESLRLQYTDNYITLEEFCKINSCAKRTARWLIDNNILPTIDTGKKTWRYKIHVDEVITYLHRRERWGRYDTERRTGSKTQQDYTETQVLFADYQIGLRGRGR